MKITITKNNQELELELRKPTHKDLTDVNIMSAEFFAELIQSDKPVIRRDDLTTYLIKKGWWNKDKDAKLMDLGKKIRDGEKQLARGGVTEKGKKFTKLQARDLALNMRVWRREQLVLIAELNKYTEKTLEGQIENREFDFLVHRCVFHNNKYFYSSYEDYIAQANEEYSVVIASKLASFLYGSATDKHDAEDNFLLQHKFVNEDLRLINDKGQLVDLDGRLIDENYRYVNEEGQLVDKEGNLVDEEGNPILEFTPFDDE